MPLAILGACGAEPEADQTSWSTEHEPPNQFFQPEEDVQSSYSQVLCVLVYFNILTGDGTRLTEMAVTLPLRNTDQDCPIFVTSVAYYDTAWLGRTGRMFDFEHDGNVDPDIVVIAKALSGGYVPVGAVLYPKWVYDKAFSSAFRPDP
jgi:hypothetical protein